MKTTKNALNKSIFTFAFFLLTAICAIFLTACNEAPTKAIASLDIVGEFKTEYLIGEDFDIQNIKLKVVYEDETNDIISLTNDMVLGFDSKNVAEQKTVTIVYKNKSIEKTYSIVGITLGIYSREDYDKDGILQYNVTEYLNFGANGTILSVNPPYEAAEETLWRYEGKKVKIYQVGEEGYVYDIVDKNTLKLTHEDGSYQLLCYKHN